MKKGMEEEGTKMCMKEWMKKGMDGGGRYE
jgi:hypothetical protein